MRRSTVLASLVLVPILFASPAAAQSVELFREDFESGTDRWNMNGFWHQTVDTSPCVAGTFPSGTHAMWYGRTGFIGLCDYDDFWWFFLSLRLRRSLDLPAGTPSTLEFWSRSEVEQDTTWDTRTVEVSADGGITWQEVFRVQPAVEPWTPHSIDLSPFAGQTIKLKFVFWAGDSVSNLHMGWLVDDVVVKTASFPVSCLGDGSATACPCGNASAPAEMAGCLNSLGTAGALRGTGVASLANDSLELWGYDMTSTTVLYYQGASVLNGGLGVVYGDGLSCTGGPIKRLGTTTNVDGASSFPLPGGPSVSVRGQITAPGTRWYQARYRNAVSFCTFETFNATNQVRVAWTF